MAAGVLGRLDLLPPENLDVINKKLTVFDEAVTSLLNQGIVFPGPPKNGFRGEMPSDLSPMDDQKLGDLLNNANAYCGWLDSEFAKAFSQYHEWEEKLRCAKADVRIRLKVDEDGKKFTVQDKDDRVENDPNVVEVKRFEIFYFVRLTILKNMRETAQKNWETVSREITIRGQAVQRVGRESNVAGVPMRTTRSFRR